MQGVWEENKKPGSYRGGWQNKKPWEHAAYKLQPNLGSGDSAQSQTELKTELEKWLLGHCDNLQMAVGCEHHAI